MPRLTHAELAEAQARGQWDVLWAAAVPLVKLAIRKSVRRGSISAEDADDDLLQQGMLVAGQAIRTWEPLNCAFSTYVVGRVRGDLFHYVTVRSRGGVGGRDQRPTILSLGDSRDGSGSSDDDCEDDKNDGTFEAALTYAGVVEGHGRIDGVGYVPLGMGDVAEEAERLTERETVRAAMGELSEPTRRMLSALYGLDGEPPMGQEEFAAQAGISSATVRRRLVEVRKKLSGKIRNSRH